MIENHVQSLEQPNNQTTEQQQQHHKRHNMTNHESLNDETIRIIKEKREKKIKNS